MKKLLAVAAAVLVLSAAQNAAAYFNSFTFSSNFGYSMDQVRGGFGSVAINRETDGFLHFTVSANNHFFASSGTGVMWDKFFFNVAPGTTLDPDSIIVDEEAGSWSVVKGDALFGNFDYGLVATRNKSASVATTKSNPPLGTLRFHIANAELTLADIVANNVEGLSFAGHLKAFDAKNDLFGLKSSSTFVGVQAEPVPLPAAFWLLGSGFAGTLLARRRMNPVAQTL